MRQNEEKVLRLVIENRGLTYKKIGDIVGLNEVSIRRICNKLKEEKMYRSVHIPNFPSLGLHVMMIQQLELKSSFLIEAKNIVGNFKMEWDNCIDGLESFDGKLIVRSIWKDTESFKQARAEFYKKFGTEWLQRENTDMIPLDGEELIRFKNF